MKPKTIEELEKENAELHDRVKRIGKEWETENRVIRLLVAADFVTEEKIEQARSLADSLR